MALYVAGQRIRASELNRLPQMYFVVSDVNKGDDTLTDVTGLGFAADASTKYFVECFIFFEAPTAADIILTWSYPASTTGLWAANGNDAGSTDVGTTNRQTVGLNQNHAFGGAAAQDVNANPYAYVLTDTTPGTVQLRFAQLVNTGSDTIIRAGSCMRVTKLN